jgi:Rad3-related DNA helicase
VDEDLHRRVDELVAEEHALRARHADGSGLEPRERQRLEVLEERLDQAWDLLRQREARRAAGLDVDQAAERPTDVVEGYLN